MPPKNIKAVENRRRAQQRECKKRKYLEIKNDPELLAIEQEKRRIRYKKRKEEGKIKSIKEQTTRAQREQRKKWRENSKRYRQMKKQEKTTPTPTFEPVLIKASGEARDDAERQTKTETLSDPLHKDSPSIKSVVRKIRYNEYKKRCVLINTINKYKKTIERQRKTIQRLNKKLQVQESRDRHSEINISKFVKQGNNRVSSSSIMSGHKSYVEEVHQFYNDDANSSISASKKEFVTKNKLKMQKRYLNAPLNTLYQKFISQVGKKISYSTFCRLRPFWTVFPKPTNRDTCLCSRHLNMELLLQGLHRACIVNVRTCEQLLSKLCCDSKNLDCLNRSCNTCSSNHLEYFNVSENNVSFYEWRKTMKEITLKNGTKKKQQLTEKLKTTMNIKTAITKFEADLIAFFNHVHKINFQYIGIKTLKNNLPVQEALLHVDFSENYALKFAEEVQAFHFGGSRQQVSLHTSVAYTHNFTSGVVTPMSYCTVDEKEIIAKERLIPKTLKPFKGTLSVYQVLWDSSVPMTVLRQLSCFDCNADMKCIHGYDLGNVPNYSHGNIENIDPNYVAPLSKSVNSKQWTQNPNKRIVILSDIKIKQSNSLYIGDYEDQNQNFNTNP
ncbi:hypothetical protein HF086_010201 [Spodoptera exigua]|uniref:Uncharacterized protein n=1 Tax=Spodoptera exigua TaxID=7107 RepID=A0A922M915_SPOEX|nr:hypothetical protein HF086_010201 [Spodoptera exigua]